MLAGTAPWRRLGQGRRWLAGSFAWAALPAPLPSLCQRECFFPATARPVRPHLLCRQLMHVHQLLLSRPGMMHAHKGASLCAPTDQVLAWGCRYDMTVSDSMYGAAKRCAQHLNTVHSPYQGQLPVSWRQPMVSYTHPGTAVAPWIHMLVPAQNHTQ